MADDTQDLPDTTGQGDGAGADQQQQQVTDDGVQKQEQSNQQQEQKQDQQAAPVTLTQEDIIKQAEERAFQRMASWQGRRDKDFFENLGTVIDTKLRNIQPQPQPVVEQIDPSKFIENPGQVLSQMLEREVPNILQRTIAKQSAAEQAFNSEVIRHAAGVMDSDPLYSDKELGNAVVAEIQKNFGNVNKRLPSDAAAQLLVSTALANVVRQRASVKTNPLAGNKPHTGPMGTIGAPAVAKASPAPVKLDDTTKRMAAFLGVSEAEAAKMLADSK